MIDSSFRSSNAAGIYELLGFIIGLWPNDADFES